eukprot:325872-Pleurochrysis_carterae.AAC.2
MMSATSAGVGTGSPRATPARRRDVVGSSWQEPCALRGPTPRHPPLYRLRVGVGLVELGLLPLHPRRDHRRDAVEPVRRKSPPEGHPLVHDHHRQPVCVPPDEALHPPVCTFGLAKAVSGLGVGHIGRCALPFLAISRLCCARRHRPIRLRHARVHAILAAEAGVGGHARLGVMLEGHRSVGRAYHPLACLCDEVARSRVVARLHPARHKWQVPDRLCRPLLPQACLHRLCCRCGVLQQTRVVECENCQQLALCPSLDTTLAGL